MDEVAALPSPAVVLSVRLDRYYGRLRRPPGSLPTSRLMPVIGRPLRRSAAVGPGRASPVPVVHLPNVPALYAGEFFVAASRVFTASMAFALRTGLGSPFPLTKRAHSRRGRLRLMLRTARSLPLEGLLTLGFDRAVSSRAASLLPGPLAVTRTGLTPAGDDELVVRSALWHHLQLSGRTKSWG